MWPPRDVIVPVRDSHFSLARERDVRICASSCLRARDFIFITGPRDFWPASTAVWCIRRIHKNTPHHKKCDPISFVVGFYGKLCTRSCPQVKCKRSVVFFFFSLCLSGTCLCGQRIPNISRDHGVIPNSAQNRGINPKGEIPGKTLENIPPLL